MAIRELPGGQLQFLTAEEMARIHGAVLEVMEEVGLDVTASRYLCSFPNWYEYGGMRYTTVDLGFVCDVEDVAVARAVDEVAEVLFVPRA